MNKSVFEMKKESGDWHYDPMVKSTDYTYLGRIVNFNCSEILKKTKWNKEEFCTVFKSEDKKKGNNSFANQINDPIRSQFSEHNTKFQRVFPENAHEIFHKVKDACKLDISNFQVLKQDPGHLQPWHFDTYVDRVEKHKLSENERKKLKRYLIFLEDWHWGHILQVGNNVVSNWSAGDVITWNFGMYHLSSNAGIVPKYTMNITGMPNENSLCQKPNFKIKI